MTQISESTDGELTVETKAQCRPAQRRSYQKHGLGTVKRKLRAREARGRGVLDGRTRLGKALAVWRADLLDDLGGAEAISAQQLALVDLAVRTKLLADSVDAYVLSMPSPVNKKRRQLFAVVVQRQALIGQLQSLLRDLGLDRRAKDVTDLAHYLATKPPTTPTTGSGQPAPSTKDETHA
jgi:hypothetical protein